MSRPGKKTDQPGKVNRTYLPDDVAAGNYHIISNWLHDLGQFDRLNYREMALLKAICGRAFRGECGSVRAPYSYLKKATRFAGDDTIAAGLDDLKSRRSPSGEPLYLRQVSKPHAPGVWDINPLLRRLSAYHKHFVALAEPKTLVPSRRPKAGETPETVKTMSPPPLPPIPPPPSPPPVSAKEKAWALALAQVKTAPVPPPPKCPPTEYIAAGGQEEGG